MSKLVKVVIPLVLVAGLAWVYASPYLALKNMKDAADRRDAPVLSSYVNFPAVKENLKASFSASVSAKAGGNNNPLAVFGTALASAFLNPMIDAIVTPEGIAAIMRGQKPKAAGGPTEPATQDAPAKNSEPDLALGYESFNRFVVRVSPKEKPEQKTTLVMLREGLSWKLNAVELPTVK
jgi:Protein of unknown function (DUF2939)